MNRTTTPGIWIHQALGEMGLAVADSLHCDTVRATFRHRRSPNPGPSNNSNRYVHIKQVHIYNNKQKQTQHISAGFVSDDQYPSKLKHTLTPARLLVHSCCGYREISNSSGDLDYQIYAASHCGDNTTKDVALKLPGTTRATIIRVWVILTAKKSAKVSQRLRGRGVKVVLLDVPSHLSIVSG
jgi:hypothetical protein